MSVSVCVCVHVPKLTISHTLFFPLSSKKGPFNLFNEIRFSIRERKKEFFKNRSCGCLPVRICRVSLSPFLCVSLGWLFCFLLLSFAFFFSRMRNRRDKRDLKDSSTPFSTQENATTNRQGRRHTCTRVYDKRKERLTYVRTYERNSDACR